MYCVDFIETASFKGSGWPPLASSLLDKLSMDKRDWDGFFSRKLVRIYIAVVHNLTD